MAELNLNSQSALAAIRSLILEVENLKKSLRNVNSSNQDSFVKLEKGYSEMREKVGLLANKLRYMESILKSNTTALNDNASAVSKNAKSTDTNAKTKDKQAKATKNSTKATKANTSATKSANTALKAFKVTLGSVLRLFGIISAIQIFTNIASSVYENTKTFDAFSFTLDKIAGSAFNAADSYRFLLQITQDYGVELVSTTNRWIKFLAAAKQSGVTLKDTEDIFRSMTKAAGVLGLRTEELQGIYLALEQMLSKGKVTTEELRRQLGERLPGAMGIMAAAVGVTLPKLDEMLKKGEVLSAEVLPKFARAVELAYDIENVERIDTIVAAQNRLTTAWQLFIKTLTEGESITKKIFTVLLGIPTAILTTLDFLIADDNQANERKIVDETKRLKQALKEQYSELLDQQKGYTDEAKRLDEDLAEARLAAERAVTDEEKKNSAETLRVLTKQKKEYYEEVNALIKENAKNQIVNVRAEYETALAEQEKFKEKATKLKQLYDLDANFYLSNEDAVITEVFKDVDESVKGVDSLDEAFERVNKKIVETTAKYALFKKLLEEPGDIGVDTDSGSGARQKRLRETVDLTLAIQNEVLKGNIAINERILASEKSSHKDRLQAIYDLHKNQTTIAENEYKIQEAAIIAKYKKEDEANKLALENQTLTREKYNDFVVKAEKEKNQRIELENEKLQNKLSSINEGVLKRISENNKLKDDATISDIEDFYNKKIIAAKQAYEKTAKTIEDEKVLNEELKKIAVEMADAIIKSRIKLLKATIANQNADEEWVKEIQKSITALEATLSTSPGLESSKEDWLKYWNTILGFAADFTSEIGNIVDGIFENKIENIGAEIEAERDKYDTLIELAKDNEQQEKDLRLEKEARIKQLEKKRLKEEQKQARARKAFAIADIGIKTAQAIMGIWADVPKYDFGISAGLMTAMVSTLGAAQIAGVLATAIPKYKEGGDIKKEHFGMVNDGLVKEYIERNGEILTTERRNAIVKLKPGDTVYKSYDDMAKRSNLINAMTNYNYMNQNEFDKLYTGIKSSIKDGFKSVKIDSKVINRLPENNSYGESMSRWN
jgi:tape measure domain-containing protein